MKTFTPVWRTAGDETQNPEIGSGRLEGEYDDTALRIVLEYADDTIGGVDRWVFQLPGDLGLDYWGWNPNGEARAFDVADNNQQYVCTAILDRMTGRIECWNNNDLIGWGAQHPFTFTAGCEMSILLVPRGQSMLNIMEG